VHTLPVPGSRKLRQAVTTLVMLLLALASSALCAQAPPDVGRARDAEAPGMAQRQASPPAMTAPSTSGDRGCVPDVGPGRGLKEADLNGDGKISRAEYMQMQEARFDRLPKDRNGLVSVEDALREGGALPVARPPPTLQPGGPPPDGALAPGAGSRRPGATQPRPAASPMLPTAPDPGSRPSGSNSPDGEPDRGPPAPAGDAASSSASSPSSTPSSSSPQEAKPGK
jgi:hypothetical protein